MTISRRGFASAQWKLPVAGIAAAGCMGLMIWNLIPSRSERTDKPKPTLVRADGTTPEPQRRTRPQEMNWESAAEDEGREYTFERVSDAGDVAGQMEAMSQVIGALNGDPSSGESSLGGSVRAFLEPLNSGNEAALTEAVTSLGGSVEPDEEGDIPTEGLYTLFSGLLRFASLDTSNIEVRPPTQDIVGQDNISVSMNRNVDADPVTGEDVETVSSTISGAPMRLFPDAASAEATGKLVELRLPFLAKGSRTETPDVVVNLQMRQMSGGRWQPAGFVVDVRNEELMNEVMQALMSRRGG